MVHAEEIVLDESGESVTEIDDFLESGELTFKGERLNTAPRRFIFAMDLLAADPLLAESVKFPAMLVFIGLANDDELISWSRNHEIFHERFSEWVDVVGFIPTNETVYDEVGEIGVKIFRGWHGTGNEPEEDGGKG